MKNSILIIFSFLIFNSAFSQTDSTNTKIYRNDTLSLRLDKSPLKISIEEVNYFLKCSFIRNPIYHGKTFPYNWIIFLRTTKGTKIPENIKPLKLFILTDTLIYEYSYLPEPHCWNKTSSLMDKPMSVIVEFIDTRTSKRYFVKAKGPFSVKH
jgi:hypothetical protein